MAKDPLQVQVEARKVLLDPTKAPIALHKIIWSRVGSEVQLEFGYFDLAELHNAVTNARKEGVDTISAQLYVTNRFLVSSSTVSQLHEDLTGIVESLKEVAANPERIK